MYGGLGYQVIRAGKPAIRLDRPHEETVFPITDRWQLDRDHRPLTRAQVAMVAFEADRKLAFLLGIHDRSPKTWLDMTDDQRVAFIKHGPPGNPPVRRLLFARITKLLGHIAQ
jgi:hypothetical protein